MAELTDRVEISVFGLQTLPREGREYGPAKSVVFEVTIDGKGPGSPRSSGFHLHVPVSSDWFDDADLIEVARARAHLILKAAASLTESWRRDEDTINGLRKIAHT